MERHTARDVRVAIEAGNQTAWIVDLLRELGVKLHVVHPLKVKRIAKSKRKTDRIDAQLLAHRLRIRGAAGPVHVPSHRSRELHQGRRAGWSASTVREILRSGIYRGEIVWGRTAKRDASGTVSRCPVSTPPWATRGRVPPRRYAASERLVCSAYAPRCRIARWRQAWAEATAAALARRHTENAALRQRMAELKPWSGRSRGGSYQKESHP